MLYRPSASLGVFVGLRSEDVISLEWFQCRTATKLPGTFNSGFWRTLLLQASMTEPAVRHAVLALSWSQKSLIMAADGGERVALQHYGTAIRRLRSHLQTRTRASARIALITCVAFVCADLIRGHFETARIHLRSGLEIAREMRSSCYAGYNAVGSSPEHEACDGRIVEVVARFHLQVELLDFAHPHPCIVPHALLPRTSAPAFLSMIDAWQELHWIIIETLCLSHRTREGCSTQCPNCNLVVHDYSPLAHQQALRKTLGLWSDKYDTFRAAGQYHEFPGVINEVQQQKIHGVLLPYNTLAAIMISTSLSTGQAIFDSQIDHFRLLLEQMSQLWIATSTPQHTQSNGKWWEHDYDAARSVTDLGCLAPLYYTALKCRDRSVRRQAISLMESISHREGFFDARTTAAIARKVVEIEEQGPSTIVINANRNSVVGKRKSLGVDVSAEPLSKASRIPELWVSLLGAPLDTVRISYNPAPDASTIKTMLLQS